MSEFYRLNDNRNEEGRWYVSEGITYDETFTIIKAVKMNLEPDVGVVRFRTLLAGSDHDVMFATLGTPIFSRRATELVCRLAPQDVTAVPAAHVLQAQDEGFADSGAPRFAIKIISRRDCLDLERSVFSSVKPIKRPQDVIRPALIAERIGGARVFRISSLEPVVIVNSMIKDSIEEAGLTGAWFQPVLVA